MKKIKLALPAMLLCLVVVAFAVILILVQKEQGNEASEDGQTEAGGGYTDKEWGVIDHAVYFTDFRAEEITALTLNGYRYTVKNGVWSWDEHPDMPLDHQLLSEIATQLTKVYSMRLIAQVPPDLYTDGFHAHQTHHIVLEAEGHQEITYTIGNDISKWGRGYHFSSSLRGDVYFVHEILLPMQHVKKTPYDLLMMDESAGIYADQMQSLVLKDKDGNLLKRGDQNDRWREQWSFLVTMEMSPHTVQAYQPTEAQLAEWGLDDPIIAEMTYEGKEGTKTFTCRLGSVKKGTGEMAAQYYVYVQLHRIVYMVPVGEDVHFLTVAQ